ncbi:ABSCISIC ACID-INSENSITIVE 5-like protein 1 [Senna tora]|uniref:ABSCISIC ACID-INSENSITIVE 5-like protein 1 n=1 Tax=Senna tora TaxID=362788 RepID=A0A834SL48_9FABA|nr:ABSCISIC ACID-INSENSITIVE 5-like protein 1 [Senna tora]
MDIPERETSYYAKLTQQKPPSSSPLPLPSPEQEEPEPKISKQNSILSLTLDEIQCKSGISFGSMSMDEFLTSIWSSEDVKLTSQSQISHDDSAQDKSVAKATDPTLLPQQGSLCVPPPICKKTVDEIWCEIHKPPENEPKEITKNETLKKEQTLGEMTLEDFLIKAGVVQESSFQNQTKLGLGFYNERNILGKEIAETPMLLWQRNGVMVREGSSSMRETCGFSGNGGRKRIIDGPPEVVVERRQRRMLKNRESAARSRARRQAYTVELEAELTQLRQENEQLKQILAEGEQRRKQEIAQRKRTTRAQKRVEKLKAMRRMMSAAW